ncbi:MAG: insulinase family protein [Bdellovibrionaceae bacterium]|nr:insulinase family protein [Pseudobdellovibrionaceae bacterium]
MVKYSIGIILLSSFLLNSCQTTKKESSSNSSTAISAAAPLVARPVASSALKLKPTKEITLENGLKVYVFRDMSLPRFSVNLMIKVGQKDDPIEKVGLNYITASLLEQGTNSYTAVQIADRIASLGSNLSIAPSDEYTFVSIDGLSMSVDAIVDIFSELIFKPAFPNSEIIKMKKDFTAQIKKVQDDASRVADLGLSSFVHRGTVLAYPSIGTEASLKVINKSDIIKNYLANYRPNNAILSIVGSITDDVEKKILDRFKAWPSRALKPAGVSAAPNIENKKMETQLKKDLVQSEIRVALPMIPRKHPDYLKLRLANEILGGGFVSRLNSKIRDQLGLTYGISSTLDLGLDRGYLYISTFTKNETTVQVLEQITAELNRLVTDGVTAKELSSAKNMVLAQFPRALETVDRIAFNFMFLDFYGVGHSYLYDFQKAIDRVSQDEINEAIRNHFKLENMKVFVLANPAIEKNLKVFN